MLYVPTPLGEINEVHLLEEIFSFAVSFASNLHVAIPLKCMGGSVELSSLGQLLPPREHMSASEPT